MPRDPDSRPETILKETLFNMMEEQRSSDHDPNLRVGFHLMDETAYLIDTLEGRSRVPVQINSGPLMTLRFISKPDEQITRMHLNGEIELFFHLPFSLQFYKPASQAGYLRDYITRHYAVVRGLGIRPNYIFHVSYPTNTEAENPLVTFRENLVNVFGDLECKVFIENLVGSNKHDKNYGYAQYISDNILQPLYKEVPGSNKKYFICFDFEHAFGGGENWRDLTPECKDTIQFVHLNGHPSNVTFGSRRDLHSFTRLQDSVPDTELLEFLATFADRPMVFERRLGSVNVADFIHCHSLWHKNLI